jgi:hypothetical protein
MYFKAAFCPPNSMKLERAARPASCATAFVSVTIFFQTVGSLSQGLKHGAPSSGEVANSFAISSYAPNRTFHIYQSQRGGMLDYEGVMKGDGCLVLCSVCEGQGRVVFFVGHFDGTTTCFSGADVSASVDYWRQRQRNEIRGKSRSEVRRRKRVLMMILRR